MITNWPMQNPTVKHFVVRGDKDNIEQRLSSCCYPGWFCDKLFQVHVGVEILQSFKFSACFIEAVAV